MNLLVIIRQNKLRDWPVAHSKSPVFIFTEQFLVQYYIYAMESFWLVPAYT